jgi:CarD family transcriptional regulator
MDFKIGDTVIHSTHGIGKVQAIEALQLAGVTQQYYVIEVKNSHLWIPLQENGECSIRYPNNHVHFAKYFDILRTPGQELPDHQYQRKLELHDRMQKITPEGLCHVIRDLTDRSRRHTLTIDDTYVLNRAKDHFIEEWEFSFQAERQDILHELALLLDDKATNLQVSYAG